MKTFKIIPILIILIISTLPASVFAADTSLSVSNKVYNTTPLYGAENYQYITVKNNGSDTATNVQVTNTYSPGKLNVIEWWVSWDNQATYVKNDSSYNPTTGIWTVGDLAVGKKVYLDLRFLTNQSGTTTSTATATSSNAPTVSKSASVTTHTSTPTIDLSLASVFGSTTPSAGSSNTLTITITQPSFSSTSGIIVNDGLPAGMTITSWRVRSEYVWTSWTSWTSNPTSYDPWTGIWNVSIGLLYIAQQLEITFTTPSTAGTTQVISTVYGNQQDTALTNNYHAAYFTVPSTLRALSLSTFSANELDSGTTSDLSSSSGTGGSGSNTALGSGIISNSGSSLSLNSDTQETGIAGFLSYLFNSLMKLLFK